MIVELNKNLLDYHEKFRLFGVLLFTEANPEIVKFLKDKEFYTALDEISGSSIALFVTMLFRGEYSYPKRPSNNIPSGGLPLMVPIWEEPSENLKILSWFDIADSRELPCLALFNLHDQTLAYNIYKIHSKSSQDIFSELENLLLPVVKQVQDHPEIKGEQLFKKTQWVVRKTQANHSIKEIFSFISELRGVIGI